MSWLGGLPSGNDKGVPQFLLSVIDDLSDRKATAA
jgi:hypothetical protein